jgi:hypothetical protein
MSSSSPIAFASTWPVTILWRYIARWEYTTPFGFPVVPDV